MQVDLEDVLEVLRKAKQENDDMSKYHEKHNSQFLADVCWERAKEVEQLILELKERFKK